jgi:lipopolysaccharide transport system ATP-binding protein
VSRSVLDLDGVWKAYPRWTGERRTVRGILARRVPALTRRGEPLWALRDVSLSLARGESVGLIGANGAGKSTLLRVASGLGRPTRGRVHVAEAAAFVLSLGDTIDLALTGRENALTAALVAGMSRARAEAAVPAALEFAELEAVADAPVRTYSDGMKLRLAFGVVAQLDPEVLLLDEVIAVGDLRFQRKCMDRIQEMRDGGAAVLLASHSLDQVEEECDRAVWLQAGGVRASGEAGAVVEEYRVAMRSTTMDRTPPPDPVGVATSGLELRRNRFGTQEVTAESVALRGVSGTPTSAISADEALTIELELRPHRPTLVDPIVGVAVHRVADGVVCFDGSTDADGIRLGPLNGPLSVRLEFERLDLVPGEYVVDVGVYEPGWAHAYDFHWQAYPLHVTGPRSGSGVFRPPHSWSVER